MKECRYACYSGIFEQIVKFPGLIFGEYWQIVVVVVYVNGPSWPERPSILFSESGHVAACDCGKNMVMLALQVGISPKETKKSMFFN